MSLRETNTKQELILTDILEKWFVRVKPKYGEVLSLYYGIEGQPMNMAEIGQQKGLSRARIQQIVARNKKNLMNLPLPLSVSRLYQFLEDVIRQNEGVLTVEVWVEAIEQTSQITWGSKRLNLLFLLGDLHESLVCDSDWRRLFQDEQTSARFYQVQKHIKKVFFSLG